MKQRRKFLVLTALVVTALVVGLVPVLPAFAAEQVLGGVTTEGDLRAYVRDTPAGNVGSLNSGVYAIQRYASGVWQNQTYGPYSKDSRLYANGTGYRFGNYYASGTEPQYTALSNVLSGNMVTTDWGARGDISVTQIVTYTPGTAYVLYTWHITNMTSTAISDLRFFHGEDTYLAGGDTGAGLWDAANNTIGVQKLVGGTLQRMVLQGLTVPYAHESQDFGQVQADVIANALTNVVDPNPNTDNGYALEWRTGSLASGQTWEINAIEKFTSYASGTVVVLAPTFTNCRVGQSCDLVFSVQNLDTSPVTVTLAVSNTQTTWPTSIVAPGGTPAISPSSTIPVTVSVSIPGGTADGTMGNVTLTATPVGGGTPGSDTGTVRAVSPGATIVKTAEGLNGAPLYAGDLIRYTVSVTNTSSTITMTNVLVTDTLPSGVTFVSATPTGYGGPNPLTWSVSSLVTGTMWSAVITVQVNSGVSSIGGNVAQVSSDEVDPLQTGPIYPPGGGDVQPYVLTINTAGTGSGDVTASPPGPAYTAGTLVTLTATPLISSTFIGWSGAVVTTTNPVTLIMDADKSVTATFTLKTYVITPTAGANGSITPGTPQTVNYGASQTFTITANTGYHIADVGVDGGSVGAVSTYTFNNITANHTISAAFAINTYVITPTAGANGSITPSTPQTVNYGASQTFTITANTGYHIADVGVDGGSVGVVSAYTFTNVTANHTITAAFAINTYVITPTAGANGSITPGTPQTVNYGASQTFTITANTGYHIADVGVDGVSIGVVSAYTFTNVTANHTITAAFAINAFTLTVNSAGTGSGSVLLAPPGPSYTPGTVVTLTAVPSSTSTFAGWSGTVVTTTNPLVLIMDSNKTVTATFNANADLAVAQSYRLNFLYEITFTLTVRNLGPNAAGGAIVSDTFPAPLGSTVWNWTCTASGGATCAASGSGNIHDTLTSFPSGSVVTYTVHGDLANWYHWMNVVEVIPPANITDIDPSNNRATVGPYQILLPLIFNNATP